MGAEYGFKAGKNKADLTPLFAAKQDQHKAVTVTLFAANWSSFYQEVAVDGLKVTDTVIVAPRPSNLEAYVDAGIYCVAQSAGKLGFGYPLDREAPAADLNVNVVVLGASA